MPDSLENYLQEIGRAGRDGQKSWALLLYKKGDEFIHRFFLEETRANRATLKSLIEGEEQAGLLESHRVTTKMGSRLFSQGLFF